LAVFLLSAAPLHADKIAFDRLPPSARTVFEAQAQLCRRLPDGSIWYVEAADRLADMADADPARSAYAAKDAPVCVDIANNVTAPSVARMQDIVAERLGFKRLKGGKAGDTPDGAIIATSSGSRALLVAARDDHFPDNTFDGFVKPDGAATLDNQPIDRFVPVLMSMQPVTAPELVDFLLDRSLDSLPRYTVKKVQDKPAEYRTRKIASGGVVRTQQELVHDATYKWQWVKTDLKLPMKPVTDLLKK
jgi:hypothetical protein